MVDPTHYVLHGQCPTCEIECPVLMSSKVLRAQIPELESKGRKKCLYVSVSLHEEENKTRKIKQGPFLEWNERFTLCVLQFFLLNSLAHHGLSSSTDDNHDFIIEVLKKSVIHVLHLGRANIRIRDLLRLCETGEGRLR